MTERDRLWADLVEATDRVRAIEQEMDEARREVARIGGELDRVEGGERGAKASMAGSAIAEMVG